MTNPCLTLDGVSVVLPDGRILFSNLDASFGLQRCGLVGRNGVGKTMLARLLAGEIAPSAGRIVGTARVHFLTQQVAVDRDATVAGLAGVRTILDALQRIEAGSDSPDDFDALTDRWDIRQRLRAALDQCGVGDLDADMGAATLSGGEAMRVALAGALLANADFLILDEPTNHLDRDGRRAVRELLAHWPRGVLVISHDRELLDSMERIVELSSTGLASYGGNYAFYAEARAREQEVALARLEHARHARRRGERELREQRERLEQRQARGARQARDANQAAILLGGQKSRSEEAAGKLRRRQDDARLRLDRQVRDAAGNLRADKAIAVLQAHGDAPGARRIAELRGVRLPHADATNGVRDLAITGGQRIAVVGPNGCGKSTLLKLLAGQVAPVAGDCIVHVDGTLLDQRMSALDPRKSTIEQLVALNPALGEDALRTRLVLLGLDAAQVAVPAGALSGGERMKAELACVLYADTAPQFLLLDEPGNHLDLPSLEALETMLREYPGTLMVVSHDETFLAAIGLSHRLQATSAGWVMETI